MVAGNTYRHPAVHAHMAATVDVISNGRLDFGVGAGWNEYEHQSMGIPLYPPGERIRRLGEACEITKRLFTQPLTDFDGRYYQLKQARCEPKPIQKPYPPFVIGGGGEQLTLRVVAQYADVWNFTAAPTSRNFQHKVRVLHEHCAAVGRDPAEIELSVQTRINYDDLAGDGRNAPAARRGRRDPPHPDARPIPIPTASSPGWPTRWWGGSVDERPNCMATTAELADFCHIPGCRLSLFSISGVGRGSGR